MKIFQAIAPMQGEFKEIPTPTPKSDEVLVKIAYCGICSTDYALFSGNSSFVKNKQATYPIRLGHEWSGVVEKVGDKVTRVKTGDNVIGDNFISCNACEACLSENYGDCSARQNVGTSDPCYDGAFAQYYLLPERHVYKLDDNVPLLDAALCEPLSVAYGGIKAMNITPQSIVLIVGTGSIGMAAAALALQKGAGRFICSAETNLSRKRL